MRRNSQIYYMKVKRGWSTIARPAHVRPPTRPGRPGPAMCS